MCRNKRRLFQLANFDEDFWKLLVDIGYPTYRFNVLQHLSYTVHRDAFGSIYSSLNGLMDGIRRATSSEGHNSSERLL